MIEVKIVFKKGFEHLYDLTDKLFVKEINMVKIEKGVYKSKENCNISEVLCDTVNELMDLFDNKGFAEAVDSCYHKVDGEVEDMKKCYAELC